MISEWETIEKEVLWFSLKHYTGICLKGLRETMKNIDGVLAKASQEPSHCK
jgi:hypothetical protein